VQHARRCADDGLHVHDDLPRVVRALFSVCE
jgi:hypothetical protein